MWQTAVTSYIQGLRPFTHLFPLFSVSVIGFPMFLYYVPLNEVLLVLISLAFQKLGSLCVNSATYNSLRFLV